MSKTVVATCKEGHALAYLLDDGNYHLQLEVGDAGTAGGKHYSLRTCWQDVPTTETASFDLRCSHCQSGNTTWPVSIRDLRTVGVSPLVLEGRKS